jgi:hypothetical protein
LVLAENIQKALKYALHKMGNALPFSIFATAVTNIFTILNTLLKKIALGAISDGIYVCFHCKRAYNIVNNSH